MFLLAFTQLGGQLLSADGTRVTINNEPGLKALEWITKVTNAQGGYPAMQQAVANGGVAAGFANGTVGYMFESSTSRSGTSSRARPACSTPSAPHPFRRAAGAPRWGAVTPSASPGGP